jgi:hypothetical protein
MTNYFDAESRGDDVTSKNKASRDKNSKNL